MEGERDLLLGHDVHVLLKLGSCAVRDKGLAVEEAGIGSCSGAPALIWLKIRANRNSILLAKRLKLGVNHGSAHQRGNP